MLADSVRILASFTAGEHCLLEPFPAFAQLRQNAEPVQPRQTLLHIARQVHQLRHAVPETFQVKRRNVGEDEAGKRGIYLEIILLEVGEQLKQFVDIQFAEVIIDAVK